MLFNDESRFFSALNTVLSRRYSDDLYRIGGYQEHSVCIEASSLGWNVYFGEDGIEREYSQCSTLLFACLTMFRKFTHDQGEIEKMEAELVQLVFGVTDNEH